MRIITTALRVISATIALNISAMAGIAYSITDTNKMECVFTEMSPGDSNAWFKLSDIELVKGTYIVTNNGKTITLADGFTMVYAESTPAGEMVYKGSVNGYDRILILYNFRQAKSLNGRILSYYSVTFGQAGLGGYRGDCSIFN